MTELAIYFGISAILVAALANISIWAPLRLKIKVLSLVLVAGILPTLYLALGELLSRPKPASIEWVQRNAQEAVVLQSKIDEEIAIYVWLLIDGVSEPRAYVLPWNLEMAKQLHRAKQRAESEGTEIKMKNPFRRHDLKVEEAIFYASNHRPLPPKNVN